MDRSAPLSYDAVGATDPAAPGWTTSVPPGYRRSERTALLGRGDDCWERVSAAVLVWSVKTRSGFSVEPHAGGSVTATQGADYTVRARIGPLVVVEPVRVVAVVQTEDRCGFAYGTRRGHPVRGEEAFVVHRDPADPRAQVFLTIRSLTRPSTELRWRLLFPVLLVAQRAYQRRYLRALAESTPGGGR